MRKIQFCNYYEIFESGEVYSLDRVINGRFYPAQRVKPSVQNGRAIRVHLHLEGSKDIYIYPDRLCYVAFRSDEPDRDILKEYKEFEKDHCIIHKDGNWRNNAFDNLELGSKGLVLNTTRAINKEKRLNIDQK